MKRTIKLIAAAATLTLGLAASAGAHVTVSPTESPSDGFAKLDFGVPHGCDGAGTTELRVQIPTSVPSVTPQVNPNWTISTKEGPKDKVDLHGETVTRGISEVTWKRNSPLPDEYLDELGMSVKLPAGEGEAIRFPAIQKCEGGKQTRWIQVPAAGETEEDLEHPAPTVTLTAAEGGHGGGAAEEEEPSEAEHASADDGEDDDDGNGLAMAALLVGGLGLVVGTGGFLSARKK